MPAFQRRRDAAIVIMGEPLVSRVQYRNRRERRRFRRRRVPRLTDSGINSSSCPHRDRRFLPCGRDGTATVLNSSVSIGQNGTGSCAWTIPKTTEPGADYRIRVSSTAYDLWTDTTDASFTIMDSTLVQGLAGHDQLPSVPECVL